MHPDSPGTPVVGACSVSWAMESQERKVPEPGEGGGGGRSRCWAVWFCIRTSSQDISPLTKRKLAHQRPHEPYPNRRTRNPRWVRST